MAKRRAQLAPQRFELRVVDRDGAIRFAVLHRKFAPHECRAISPVEIVDDIETVFLALDNFLEDKAGSVRAEFAEKRREHRHALNAPLPAAATPRPRFRNQRKDIRLARGLGRPESRTADIVHLAKLRRQQLVLRDPDRGQWRARKTATNGSETRAYRLNALKLVDEKRHRESDFLTHADVEEPAGVIRRRNRRGDETGVSRLKRRRRRIAVRSNDTAATAQRLDKGRTRGSDVPHRK